MDDVRPPLPPFDLESAVVKARKAEDAWNGKQPQMIAMAYTEDSKWRNRSEIFSGRPAIIEFLTKKWEKEKEYRLIKEVWAYSQARIAVRFAYEWHDASGLWYRSYGNENWAFDDAGRMSERHASINDLQIHEKDRKLVWEGTARPADYPNLTELGL